MRSDCVKIQNPNSRRKPYGWAENLWIQDPESRAWVARVKITGQVGQDHRSKIQRAALLSGRAGGRENHRSKSQARGLETEGEDLREKMKGN